MEPQTLPRIEGDCLVVQYGQALPEICAITGEKDGLARTRENLSSGGALLLLLLGPLGFALGRKSAHLEYSISVVVQQRIQKARAVAGIFFAVGLLALVALFIWPSLELFAGFVMAFAASLIARYGYGRSLNIANIWQGEIFIRALPQSIVDGVLKQKLT